MPPYPYAAVRPGPSPGSRSTLSVLWTLALVGFLIFMALNFAGLVLSPAYVVPGIQGIASGQNANQDLSNGNAGWSFQDLNASGATGTYAPTGGNPGGGLQMTLPPGTNVAGEWVEAVTFTGSAPFFAEARFDVRIQAAGNAPLTGAIVVTLEGVPNGLSIPNAPAVLWLNQSTPWTHFEQVDVSAAIGGPGTYYLKIAYHAVSAAATTTVSFDNIHLGWATDAQYYFYLPLPLPLLLFWGQDSGIFLAYFGVLVAAILAAAAWYTWRDRKLTLQAFTAPLEAIGTRLRSRSGWVAVGQVWLATTFFSVALIYLLAAIGPPPTSPFTPTAENAWSLLFDYTAASVFEEVAFRAFLIGVPMAVVSLGLRLWNRRSQAAPPAPGAPRPSVLGSLRYLWGGQIRTDSPREALLAAWILGFVRSLLFGLAHAPGWGWWKVLPAFVAGLGMAYVYLRHGLAASILVHFATDGSLALSLEGVGGDALTLATDLMFLGLAIAGSGFFVWYVLEGWKGFQDLRRRFGGHVVRMPAGAGPAALPPGSAYPPPPWMQTPTNPYPPAPPAGPPPGAYGPPPGYGPPPQGWSPAPQPQPAARPSLQLPQGYAPSYHPTPFGFPPVRFQCPACGWVEARYDAGHFTCLRCGRTA